MLGECKVNLSRTVVGTASSSQALKMTRAQGERADIAEVKLSIKCSPTWTPRHYNSTLIPRADTKPTTLRGPRPPPVPVSPRCDDSTCSLREFVLPSSPYPQS